MKNSIVKPLIKAFTRFLKIRFRSAIVFLIDLYRVFFRSQMGYSCRFQPTCSCYTKEAFQKWGLAKGFVFSLNRLLRCHPFSRGGFDPVPAGNPKQWNKDGRK